MGNEDISKLQISRTSKEKIAAPKRRSVYKKIILSIFLCGLVLVIFLLLFMSPVPVETVGVSQIYPSQTFTVLNASGYIVAQRKAAVASKITGRLVSLSVEEGSRIKKNEIIARLENEDAQASYNQAVANLNVSKHALEQAQAEQQDATVNYKRAGELVHKGYVSKSDYDAATARYLKAQAGVSAAEASVKANHAAVQAAQTAVEYALIRAPFDAVVLTKNADVGDIVTPLGAAANAKASVVSIADMGSLQVEADVSESNVTKVKMKQPCEIQLDAIPERHYRGEVHMIVPTADRNKASIMVKVRFLEKDERILPEMSAKVAFLSRTVKPDEEKPRTAVPSGAVVNREGKKVVYLVHDGRISLVSVKTREQLGDMIEVTEGVKPGDKLVMNPSGKLKEGSRVKVNEK